METAAVMESGTREFQRIASPVHTFVLLAAEGVLVWRGAIRFQQLHSAADLNRLQMYERTILTQWLGFAFVIFGVWLAGSPLATVLGERWRSAGQVLRDIGIGVGFAILSTLPLSVIGQLLGGTHAADGVACLTPPHGGVEMTMWIALSATAGICEETLFRGYLQRQFMALTQNVPAGILLSAAAFGAAHSYQGWPQAFVIGLEGALLGAMTYWRKSVRPGMIAHAWKDAMAPILMSAMRH